MRVGVSRLVCVSKWLGFVVSLVFTVGRIGEYCLLGKLDDLLYYSYFATLNTQVAKLETYFDYLTPATCFACNVIELVLFIIIVSELLRLHIRRVRQRPDAAERHARKNAITATGHFLSWVTEMILYGAINVVVHFPHTLDDIAWVFFMLFPSINYVVFPTIQSLTSPEMRRHVFSCDFSKCKCGGKGEDQVQAALMQGLPNGIAVTNV